YEELAWPRAFAALYRRHGVWLAAVLALALSAFLVLALALNGTLWREAAGGNFYAVFPHGVMVSIFGPVFLYALLALAVGARRFWRHCIGQPMAAAAAGPAAADVLRLKNLDGGHGEGCPNEDDRPSRARRRLHQVTLYGFLLCFASTAVATLYHYGFGWQAPYAFLSVPVLLGTAGGIGLLIGPAGLYWLARRRDPQLSDPAQAPLDTGLMLLLLLTSATGLALLAGRATPAMPLLLAVHLGCVLAFFLTMPYGKFAHAVYRSAALLAWAAERRQPNRLRVGGE
ncbi:MAG TPA: tricarballylate utilization 4Fe-4S protein TcuB, partial [Burkholderiaceae bacterium]|nr:tricarballylate utilization 4Fe-4S protein TcuB [Burkholderiaceae bacterium]